MWAVEDYLRRPRRECEELFDYRYSVLPLVFARLIREGHLDEGQLTGLAEEKLEFIRRVSTFLNHIGFLAAFGGPRLVLTANSASGGYRDGATHVPVAPVSDEFFCCSMFPLDSHIAQRLCIDL